ncbi:MAG: flavodoxin domain-containing protein [Clostridia bacterium]|nr:flavodoxin domain-containing protein [Clostridia bacterium]
MKTIIIYESTHHENTYKLVKAIADKHKTDIVSVEKAGNADLNEYDLIGFASGIAFGKFYKEITEFAKNNMPHGKSVFFIYTCGSDNGRYADGMKKIAADKGCKTLGVYACRGYDTYGPFKLVGGINKKCPTDAEIDGAVSFFGQLIK